MKSPSFVLMTCLLALAPDGPAQTSHAGHDHAAHGEDAEHAAHGESAVPDDHASHADNATHVEPAAHDDHAGHDDHAAHGEPAGHNDHAGHDDHADEVRLTAEAVADYGVRVAPAEARTLAATFAAPARIGFNRERMAHIGTSVTGRAADLAARLGDTVAAGDVLLTVRSPELGGLQGDYLAAAAAVEAARPAVEIARSAYDRAQELYDDTQGISLSAVQDRATQLRMAERDAVLAGSVLTSAANVLRLHGMTDDDLATLADTQRVAPAYAVRAPIDGTVIERHVTPGELVGPEDEALLVLADLSNVWALIDVPESRLADVAVGSEVALRLDVSAEPLAAVVTYIDPRVNDTTRTGRLRVELPNPDGRLRPGMFAEAVVTTGEPAAHDDHAGHDHADHGVPAVPAVPAAAVIEVEGSPSVFVPVSGEPNTFARRVVTPGLRSGGWVAVTDGLAIGEPVVVEGTFILKAELGKAGVKHVH